MIHLRGRLPEGWLDAPDTAPDGAVGPKPHFGWPEADRMGCALQLRPIRLAAIHKASYLVDGRKPCGVGYA
jgi:hypothetical protein